MNHEKVCPICGEGKTALRVDQVETTYKEQVGRVAFRLLECESCGSDFAGPAEALANKRAVVAFRKKVDGLLSGQEIRALRERMDISQKQAAQLFGGGPVAFSKYENDDVAQAESMDKLLRVASEQPSALAALQKLAGVHAEVHQPRVERRSNVFVLPVVHLVAHISAARFESEFEPIGGQPTSTGGGTVSSVRLFH
jgi:HTH-type transcriptional regulator / antitoxin MqsA